MNACLAHAIISHMWTFVHRFRVMSTRHLARHLSRHEKRKIKTEAYQQQHPGSLCDDDVDVVDVDGAKGVSLRSK